MASSGDTPCSGYCLPFYLFGGISAVGILSNLFFDRKISFLGRLSLLIKSVALAGLFGLLIFLLCKSCYRQYAYTALVLPSLWFGINMFLLLLQNRKSERGSLRDAAPVSPLPRL
jgi:hypothetical protein